MISLVWFVYNIINKITNNYNLKIQPQQCLGGVGSINVVSSYGGWTSMMITIEALKKILLTNVSCIFSAKWTAI